MAGAGVQRSNTVPVAPLDADELAAWRATIETAEFLLASIDGDLAVTGLSLGEYQVLVLLSESAGERMRMVDLAASLRLSPSGLTRRIDGLVRNGYVERVASDTDRRVMLAVLSPAGQRKLVEAYPTHLASVRRRFVTPVQRADLEALTVAFGAISRALAEDCD